MRALRFRVWGKYSSHGNSKYYMRYEINSVGEYSRSCEPIYGKIMQWTGLTDKNGVEIFEGDILIPSRHKKPRKRTMMKISFYDGGFCYTYNNNMPTNLSGLIAKGNKVVGNIFENTELLEETK